MIKFIGAAFIGLLFPFFAVSAERIIDCNIIHTLHHGGDTISVTYKLHMAKSIGTMAMYGIFDGQGKKSVISRQIIFRYSSMDNAGYQLTSDKIIPFSAETARVEDLQKHYPSFFLKPEMSLFMTVRNFSEYSLVISFVSDALFVCSKP